VVMMEKSCFSLSGSKISFIPQMDIISICPFYFRFFIISHLSHHERSETFNQQQQISTVHEVNVRIVKYCWYVTCVTHDAPRFHVIWRQINYDGWCVCKQCIRSLINVLRLFFSHFLSHFELIRCAYLMFQETALSIISCLFADVTTAISARFPMAW
jgi:hypothetical protein